MRCFLTVLSFLLFISQTSRAQIEYGEFNKPQFTLSDTAGIEWSESDDYNLNFGLTSKKYIIRIRQVVDRTFWKRQNFLLIDNPILDSICFYQIVNDTVIELRGGEMVKSDFNSSHSIYFPIKEDDSNELQLFLIVNGFDQLLVPAIFVNYEEIQFDESFSNSVFLIYLGILLAMFIYNIIIYFTVRDRVYLFYIFYITTVGITQFILFGFIQRQLGIGVSRIAIFSSLFPALSGVATILFAQNFIRTKEYSIRIHKTLNFFMFLYALACLLSLLNQHFVVQIILNLGAASAVILIIASINAIRGGFRPAKFFLVSWCLFIVGLMVYALRNFGILPFNNFTNFALPVGSVIEILLLSFALADRINVLKHEKEISQQLAFTTMQENERLIKEQNTHLENKVHERTIDLENRNAELNQALAELKTTQQQLVESEKLASLGQMTAGIAHEINNPINFVQSNVGPLKRDIADILSLLSEFESIDDKTNIQEKITRLKDLYNKLDVGFLKQEIEQLLNGIEEGSMRTAEIVKGLRIFSRMDKNERVSADINECLASTLIVLKNMTKAEVTLNVQLENNIPKIDCYPGKLSQVFMNLITNAVQATKLPNRQPKDRIINVSSKCEQNFAVITISDNGPGINDEIHDKIFEPFFTTKDVGEGTGLGLSIVHGIIAEHNGSIQFKNLHEGGACFIINIPLTNTLNGNPE